MLRPNDAVMGAALAAYAAFLAVYRHVPVLDQRQAEKTVREALAARVGDKLPPKIIDAIVEAAAIEARATLDELPPWE